MHRSRFYLAVTGVALATAAAGCGGTDAGTTEELVPVSVSLAQSNAAALAGVSLLADSSGGNGPIRPAMIDSLIVTVRRVDVLPTRRLHRCHPPLGDSASGFRPGPRGGPGNGGRPGGDLVDSVVVGAIDCFRPHPDGPFGPGRGPRPERPEGLADSLLPPDTGWGSRPWHWFSLAVLANGSIDLTNLPTDSADGIVLAAGRLPAGDYVAARLIITSATIWLNTTITTDSGVVLLPDTPYEVKLPRRGDGPMGILTRTGFTVPEDGRVLLLFDPDVTIGHAVVTSNGTILIRPVLHPRW